MRRRALLTAVGANAGVVSGCLSLDSGTPPDIVLGLIEIVNNSSQSVDLHVEVLRKEELVYDEIFALDPVDESGDYPSLDSRWISEPWMGAPVEYEITASTVDGDLTASNSTSETIDHLQRYSSTPSDGDCFAWDVDLGHFPTRELEYISIGNGLIDPDNASYPHNCE